MDIPRIFNITESAHRIHNPITPEKLATLGAALRLESGRAAAGSSGGDGGCDGRRVGLREARHVRQAGDDVTRCVAVHNPSPKVDSRMNGESTIAVLCAHRVHRDLWKLLRRACA